MVALPYRAHCSPYCKDASRSLGEGVRSSTDSNTYEIVLVGHLLARLPELYATYH